MSFLYLYPVSPLSFFQFSRYQRLKPSFLFFFPEYSPPNCLFVFTINVIFNNEDKKFSFKSNCKKKNCNILCLNNFKSYNIRFYLSNNDRMILLFSFWCKRSVPHYLVFGFSADQQIKLLCL